MINDRFFLRALRTWRLRLGRRGRAFSAAVRTPCTANSRSARGTSAASNHTPFRSEPQPRPINHFNELSQQGAPYRGNRSLRRSRARVIASKGEQDGSVEYLHGDTSDEQQSLSPFQIYFMRALGRTAKSARPSFSSSP